MKWLLYGTVAVVSFAVFLVAFAPASLLWSVAKDDVERAVPDLQVLTVDGSVWNGHASLRFREFPPVLLAWRADRLAAISQRAHIDLTLEGPGLKADGKADATRGDLIADAAGFIDSDYINPVSSRYGLTFPGRITVDNLAIRSDLVWFNAADGRLNWEGGRVMIQTVQGLQSILMPPLEGVLDMEGSNLRLNVLDASDPDRSLLIQVLLKPNGWAVVDIKARLLTTAGLPFRGGTSPNASAVILEEKLF